MMSWTLKNGILHSYPYSFISSGDGKGVSRLLADGESIRIALMLPCQNASPLMLLIRGYKEPLWGGFDEKCLELLKQGFQWCFSSLNLDNWKCGGKLLPKQLMLEQPTCVGGPFSSLHPLKVVLNLKFIHLLWQRSEGNHKITVC